MRPLQIDNSPCKKESIYRIHWLRLPRSHPIYSAIYEKKKKAHGEKKEYYTGELVVE